ncbi:MAG: hypothetical protein D6798_02510 [Deltaproteobacteria bacterium]|nr:MAG: hypothetical protein D6798_02510 [Deltaproteobacteria bacterium]
MPELPEVEIARRQLARRVAGRRLDEVIVRDPQAIRGDWSTRPRDALPDGPARLAALVGAEAGEPMRHGKRLGWPFPPGGLLIHLGMSGAWVPGEEPPHARVGLRFGDAVWWFRDPRRFGALIPCPAARLADRLAAGLGPDALLAALPGPALAARFRTRAAIKVALMDQGRLAGLGNIHAAEALFRARIHPAIPANALSDDQWEALSRAIVDQLRDAIDAQQDGELVYLTEGGPNPFAVYGREGEPCPRCGTPIARIALGGRSTFYCPRCQPAP